MAEENKNRNDFIYYESKFKESIVFIDNELEKGNPIMVGVDHTFKYRKFGKINEDTTDHYVLIIGRSILDGEIIYNYWDVGTYNGGKGDYYFSVESNRMVSSSRGKDYIMTQVRKNYKI